MPHAERRRAGRRAQDDSFGNRAWRAVAIGLLLGGALVALIRWTPIGLMIGPMVYGIEPPSAEALQKAANVLQQAASAAAAAEQAASTAAAPPQLALPASAAAAVTTPSAASADSRDPQLAIEAAARGLPASLDTLDELLHRGFNAANAAADKANVAPNQALQEQHLARVRALLATRAGAPTGDAARAVLLTHLARTLYRMQRYDELRPVAEQQHRALVHWYLEALRSQSTPVAPAWLGLAAIGSVTLATHYGFADNAIDDMLPRAQEAYGILERLLPRDADEFVLAAWLKNQLSERRRWKYATLNNRRAAQMAF